jgi:Domain of unknown function (DUF305)
LVALLAACGRGAASPLPAEHPSGVNDADVGFLQTLTGTRFDLGLLTMMRTHHAGAVELAETELRRRLGRGQGTGEEGDRHAAARDPPDATLAGRLGLGVPPS